MMETSRLNQLIERNTSAVFPSELSLFQVPPLNASYSRETVVDYRPVNSALNDGGPVEFTVPASTNQYVSLKRSKIFLRARIVREDGTSPPATDMVAPANWIIQTMFAQLELYIQGKLVTGSGGQLHPYRAMFEALLDQSADAKATSMQAGLYYKDTAFAMDDFTMQSQNEGFSERFAMTAFGSMFELSGPILTDLAQQDRLLLNGTELTLKFWPGRPAFHLLTAMDNPPGHKIEILEAYLKIVKLTPLPAITLAHARALEVSPALYPFMKCEIKAMNLTSGSFGFTYEDIFNGSVPAVLVIGMVTSEAFAGSYKTNPFHFRHQLLTNLTVHLDDVPLRPVKTMFSGEEHEKWFNKQYLQGYDTLFDQTSEGVDAGASFCDVTRKEYSGGYTLFEFRIAPGHHPEFLPTVATGNIRIQGTFGEALATNTTVLCYGRFPSLLTINNARNVDV